MQRYFGQWQEVPLSAVYPEGWLKTFLQTQANGLTGHLEEAGYPFDSVSWAKSDAPMQAHAENPGWWVYEQTAYQLDGLERTALLLRDETLREKAETILKAVIEHPDEDGYLGPLFLKESDGWMRWPHVVFFRALMARYSAAPDAALLQAVVNHYLNGSCRFDRFRDVMNVEILLWAYHHTGDERLLSMAQEQCCSYNEHTFDDNTSAAHLSRRKPYAHGVTYNEFAKLGAILYLYTGDTRHLKPSVKAYEKIDRWFMLVDGLHCSNEFLLDNDYMRCHETCDVSDYTWSLGYLLMATGDGAYADRIERCIFNAGIGSVDEEFKALQYFSCPNQLVLDRHSNHNDFFKGDAWMSYRPNPGTECCPGNVNRFFPNYCARMWMQRENGIAAVLYGASKLVHSIGDQTICIDEITDYPFEDTVCFRFSLDTPLSFSFYLRIPSWCTNPHISVNGEEVTFAVDKGFAKVERAFAMGDTVTLCLPSEAKICTYHDSGRFVEKGPLVYTLGMMGERVIDADDERSSEAFPAYNMYPDKPWNFGLEAKETKATFVRLREMSDSPWHIDRVPCAIRVAARRINGWTLTHRRKIRRVENLYERPWRMIEKTGDFRFTPRHPSKRCIQQHGVGETQMLTLVPMACAKVRLTIFPTLDEDDVCSKASPYYVYMVKCRDGSLYCGYTDDVQKRVAAHNSGAGAKYTKSRRPVTLVYTEVCASKSEALKREYAIKQLSRAEKEALIQSKHL